MCQALCPPIYDLISLSQQSHEVGTTVMTSDKWATENQWGKLLCTLAWVRGSWMQILGRPVCLAWTVNHYHYLNLPLHIVSGTLHALPILCINHRLAGLTCTLPWSQTGLPMKFGNSPPQPQPHQPDSFSFALVPSLQFLNLPHSSLSSSLMDLFPYNCNPNLSLDCVVNIIHAL